MLRTFAAISAVAICGVCIGIAGPATAHFLGEDSVDGSEIRYEDGTQWNTALADSIAAWEAIPGGVSIAPDSATTVTDLEVEDYSANDGNCGYWDGQTGADLLALNDDYFVGAVLHDRKACMLHEWGHAHGLAHSYDDQAMDDCPVSACGSAYINPQSHDIQDYNTLWN